MNISLYQKTIGATAFFLLCLLSTVIAVGQTTGRTDFYQSLETKRMAERLTRLYRNRGDGTFTDVTKQTKLAVDEIEIRWPVAGKTQRLHDLSLDRQYRLREGESRPAVVELKRFSLSGRRQTEPHRHH